MGGLWVRVREKRISGSVAKMGDKREKGDTWHEIEELGGLGGVRVGLAGRV